MRTVLNENQIDKNALHKMAGYHSDVIEKVKKAVSTNKVVVIGMKLNVFVKKARKALDEANVKYEYLEFGGYTSKWKKRLAIKLWSGWPTFPQVFVDGKLIGGAAETLDWLKTNNPARA